MPSPKSPVILRQAKTGEEPLSRVDPFPNEGVVLGLLLRKGSFALLRMTAFVTVP